MAESIHDSGGISMPYAMNPSAPDSPIIEELLAQADWVRNLAGQLVLDPHAAEDLAQETLIRAIEAPPAQLRHARAWLATVLRNLAAGRFRSESRRRQREEHAATPEALPATGELVERAHLQRELAGLVLKLDERTREVLLLRFFEGLAPRHIAAQLELPVATVHTRIERGLAKLREQLEREYGGRKDWIMAFAPLLPRTAALQTGILFVNAKILLTAATALVLAAAFQLWPSHLESPGPKTLSLASSRGPDQPLSLGQQASELVAPQAQPSPGRVPLPSTPAASLATIGATTSLTGLAVDEFGRPVANVELRLSTPELDRAIDTAARLDRLRAGRDQLPPDAASALAAFELDAAGFLQTQGASALDIVWVRQFVERGAAVPATRTASDGRFRIELPTAMVGPLDHIAFVSTSPDIVVVGGGMRATPGAASGERVVITAPAVTLTGTVQTEAGAPIEDASLSVPIPIRLLRNLPWSVTETWEAPLRSIATSSADGRFTLERAPLVDGVSLLCRKQGFGDGRIALETSDHNNIRFVLVSPRTAPVTTLRGLVIGNNGQPVEAAKVRLGGYTTSSDTNGRFTLELPWDLDGLDHLYAVKRGLQAAFLPAAEVAQALEDELTLRLGPSALSISGTLDFDRAGAPEGWRVNLLGTTSFGSSTMSLESASADELVLGGPWGAVSLDATGQFHFGGLSDKDYTLRFWNADSGENFDIGPLAAGRHDVDVAAPQPLLVPLVRGHVVDSFGRPVAGARVSLLLTIGSFAGTPAGQPLRTETTAADGSFSFDSVPSGPLRFGVSGDSVKLSTEQDLPDPFSKGPLRLEVECIWRFVPKLGPADPADRFRVVDADGETLRLQLNRQGVTSTYKTAPLSPDAFLTVETSTRAAELILLNGDTELRRVPLDPRPGPVQTLEL